MLSKELRNRIHAFRLSKSLAVATLCLAFFTDDFIYGILVPVLPFSLRTRSHVPESDLQFWTSAMMAGFGFANLLASPILGWLADKSPSRRFYLLIGLTLQAAGTVMFGVGKDAKILFASRLLQGVSAAIIYTGGLVILVDTVERDEIGKWMGFVLSFANAGILISPIVGGLLYGALGYNAIFIAMGILVALDLSLRFLMADKPTRGQTIAEEGPANADDSSLHGQRSEREALLGNAHKNQEDRGRRARIRNRMPAGVLLLEEPRVAAAVIGVSIAQGWITAFDGVLPLFMKRTFDWGPSQAGLQYIALVMPTVAAPFSGALSDRFGPRLVSSIAFMIATCAHALLPLVNHPGADQVALLSIILVVLGLAFSAMIAPLGADLAAAVEQLTIEDPSLGGIGGAYGQVFALLNCAISFGTLVGPPVAGLMYERLGWPAVGFTLATLSALGAVPIIIYTGGKRELLAGSDCIE